MGFIGRETLKFIEDERTRRVLEELVDELERLERLNRPLDLIEQAIAPTAFQRQDGPQVQVGMFVALEGGWAVPGRPALNALPVGVAVQRQTQNSSLGDGGGQAVTIRYVTAGAAWVLLEDAGAEMLSEIYVGHGAMGSTTVGPLTEVRVKAGQLRAKRALPGVGLMMGLVMLDWMVIKPR